MNLSMRLLATLTFALSLGTAAGEEIYKWVGPDGVSHYSDEKPGDDVAVTTIEVAESSSPGYDPAEDPYSIRNQARRINATLTALERERSERANTQQQSSASEQARLEHQYDDGYRYRDPWGYRPGLLIYPPSYLRPARPGIGRRQIHALEELDLTGPRPQSINSGAHYDRVQRSAELPAASPGRPDRPQPR